MRSFLRRQRKESNKAGAGFVRTKYQVNPCPGEEKRAIS
ncbi:hypothetical protein OOU_Y34scaffold00669g58 [Pyricularia oryzae Y34]|uniref:Uncharacterized protein n=1 Tax=Pyricularia oryzae (strain Y34) TaxID=1143189 RepID=A0AA97NTJ8_PYRO3|nr:hypothetical protein OOU_Y34scaffold00669g58 [Pyricularia oryzae Y34]